MASERGIEVGVHLLPPLCNTAGRERVRVNLPKGATIQELIDTLLGQFGDPEFRLHLYDTAGRLIPAWSVFINGKSVVRLGRQEDLSTPLSDGDEVTFLLALAGG